MDHHPGETCASTLHAGARARAGGRLHGLEVGLGLRDEIGIDGAHQLKAPEENLPAAHKDHTNARPRAARPGARRAGTRRSALGARRSALGARAGPAHVPALLDRLQLLDVDALPLPHNAASAAV